MENRSVSHPPTPVVPSATKQARLEGLLCELFSSSKVLRRFVARLPGGQDVCNDLPFDSLAQSAHELVAALDSRGMIDLEFFLALLRERQKKSARIQLVAESWGVTIMVALDDPSGKAATPVTAVSASAPEPATTDPVMAAPTVTQQPDRGAVLPHRAETPTPPRLDGPQMLAFGIVFVSIPLLIVYLATPRPLEGVKGSTSLPPPRVHVPLNDVKEVGERGDISDEGGVPIAPVPAPDPVPKGEQRPHKLSDTRSTGTGGSGTKAHVCDREIQSYYIIPASGDDNRGTRRKPYEVTIRVTMDGTKASLTPVPEEIKADFDKFQQKLNKLHLPISGESRKSTLPCEYIFTWRP